MTDFSGKNVDRRAVDTARILAADAVEMVGNGTVAAVVARRVASVLVGQRPTLAR